jgi:RNA polymerase sigma-70 factor, ECF subfamily
MMAFALAAVLGTRGDVAGVQRHHLPTWEGLVQTQYARIYNLHLRLVGSPETAADLTQDTFEQAWRAAAAFEGRSQTETWLYGVALNVNRHWRQRSGLHDPPEGDPSEELPDPAPTTQELALLHQRQELICEAVARLPESYRRVVVMHYFMGTPSAEIARAEGVPDGTMRWRLHQALRKLWVMLQPTLGKELGEDEQGTTGTLRIAP